jgi:hypothetical protein
MQIALGSDHADFLLKQNLAEPARFRRPRRPALF